ncbi:GerAB/ArcD/ProY family transporter, partial [Paenibacillus sp. TAF58]
PVFRGGLIITSLTGESYMIVMLISFISNKKKVLFSSLWGVGISCLFLLNSIAHLLMVFGNSVPAKLQYPIFSFIQYISVMGFIQNMDILVVVGFIFSIYLKLSLYLFITSYGSAQLFQIRNWRKVIWVPATLIFIVSLLPRNIDESQVIFPMFLKNIIFPIFRFGVPTLLLLIAILRRKNLKSMQAD